MLQINDQQFKTQSHVRLVTEQLKSANSRDNCFVVSVVPEDVLVLALFEELFSRWHCLSTNFGVHERNHISAATGLKFILDVEVCRY